MKLLEELGSCIEGMEFASEYPTLQDAWTACPRGDWMLWLAKRLGVDLRTLTLAKALCASTVRHLMKDPRSLAAIDAAVDFGRGKIMEQKLKKAAYAAVDAVYAAYAAAVDAAAAAADAAAAAADAAAYAAYAAAVDAAAAAADAAAVDAAAYAAAVDAADAARIKNRQQTADICRKILTVAVFERLAAKGAKE
jgi:hypothetical protein